MQPMNHKQTREQVSDREGGSVLIIALIMLVLLTIIGISASKTSEIEVMIAGNERVAKENFYVAEGSVRRSVMILQNTDLKNNAPHWIYQDFDPDDAKAEYKDMETGGRILPASAQENHSGSYGFPDVEEQISGTTNWTDTYSQQFDDMSGDARCVAVKRGLAGQTSAKATGPLPYDHAVYGRSEYKRGLGLIAVGYRKAY